MLTAMRRASSLVSKFAAARRPRLILELDIGQRVAGDVLYDEARLTVLLDGPRRQEAAGAGHGLCRRPRQWFYYLKTLITIHGTTSLKISCQTISPGHDIGSQPGSTRSPSR